MKTLKLAIAAIIFASSSMSTFAHSGGTDKNGCHHNRKDGSYHCH